ncbi:CBO0543 family protein [Neobacillus vireti]
MIKALYNFFHTSFITGLEVLLVKYTRLIRYKKWNWYWSFFTMFAANHLSHVYYKWFFKEPSKKSNCPTHSHITNRS